MILQALLLSLLLLSYMVVFIRELVNKFFSTSVFNLQPLQMAQLPFNMNINIGSDIIRGILQTQDLRVGQVNKSCIEVNIRELDRELSTGLSTLYTKSP